jgi:hypothetical protein
MYSGHAGAGTFRLYSATLLEARIPRSKWFLWEVHTDDCRCSYCGKWRGRRMGFFPCFVRHGWSVLTFRMGGMQHYLRVCNLFRF